jgi:hypothetical protein
MCGRSADWFPMVIESIREFNRTVPFSPYEARMASGERNVVPHADFVSVSPRGSFVIVFEKIEPPYHLGAIASESATPLDGHRRRKSGRRSPR